MHTAVHRAWNRNVSSSSGWRLLLVLLAAVAALLVLSACGKVSSSTEIAADGSGVHTLTVVIGESDMGSITGGAATVEAAIEEHNPGLAYQGMTKNGTDTVFTFALEFTDAKDYAAKAQPVLAAGELTKTAEVTFTAPQPPFNPGYTFSRNFDDEELTRWAVKALIDDGSVENAAESDIDSALEADGSTVSVDGAELERQQFVGDGSADWWSNATSVSTEVVTVVTTGAEDPAADSYTRTITYELERGNYLEAKEDFDAFFAAATPEGGELTPAGEAGTTWVVAFPAGTAAQVASWTDTALATTGSAFSVEAGPNPEDPFSIDTRVVDTIDCALVCGESGVLEQYLEVPADFTGSTADLPAEADAAEMIQVGHEGGTEPALYTRSIGFRTVDYDVEVNRKGGGTLTMALSLPAEDDALVTEENVLAFLGEDTERSEEDGTVTYTRVAEADSSEEFRGALQKLGFVGDDAPPSITVDEMGGGDYQVTLALGLGEEFSGKVGEQATWTIHGDGLRPTSVVQDEAETAVLGEDSLTVEGQHGVLLVFTAERTGLGAGAIVAILAVLAVLGLLIAAGVVAFLNRERIKALVAGASTGASNGSAEASEPQNPAERPEQS